MLRVTWNVVLASIPHLTWLSWFVMADCYKFKIENRMTVCDTNGIQRVSSEVIDAGLVPQVRVRSLDANLGEAIPSSS